MSMKLRHLEESDYKSVIAVVNEWWGGRQVAHLLPKLFFQHFRPTSFAAETAEGSLAGFLVGFISQTNPTQVYIHFVGVSPDYRAHGVGRILYEQLFATAKALGCQEVLSITSPVNKGSQAFHKKMGFEILPGEVKVADLDVVTDYDGYGEDRVRFRRVL